VKKKSDVLLILPSLLGFAAFLIIPFVYSFYYAFTESAFSHKFVWFKNFKMLIENEYFRLAFKNTMTFTAVTVPLIMVLSVVVSMVLVQYAMKLPIVRSALFLPVLLPSAAIVMFWQAYFNDMQPFQSLVLFFLWKYAGLNIMLIMTALLTVPKETLESAQLDGAGIVRRTWSLILPQISPTLFFTFILSVVNSLKIFKESYLLYGSYPDESVYMLQNYLNNHFEKLNYQNISTAAIFFAVIVYVIVGVIFAVETRISRRMW
jgi:ABC-type sugar transport systems, permease components